MSIGIAVKILNLRNVSKALKDQIKRYGGSPAAQVGVGTTYAVPVHERIEVQHKPPTRSLFLSSVVDEIKPRYLSELAARTRARAGSKHPLHIALYEMALKLDAMIVPLIPVATGRLRSTHYAAPPAGTASGSAPTKPKAK